MDATLDEFMAITGATRRERAVAFLAGLENNLELALASFFEISEEERSEFGVGDFVDPPPPPPPPVLDLVADAGLGMVEAPPAQRALVEISVLGAHVKLKHGREDLVMGSPLASSWRLHVSFNSASHVTSPVQAAAEMHFGESFTSVLSESDVGILLVELRNLLDVTLAMGGLEVSRRTAAGSPFAALQGSPLALGGEVAEGFVTLRIVAHETAALRLPPALPPPRRPHKLRRSRSLGGIDKGVAAPKPAAEAKLRGPIEPLSAACSSCGQDTAWEALVVPACGHRTRSCRRCWRELTLAALAKRKPDTLACGECGVGATEDDLSLVLSAAELDRYREMQLELFLEQDELIVRCANPDCRCPMEKALVRSQDLLEKANGPDGAPLVGVHLRHYNEHRMRCPACASDFCSSCQALPYHGGYTCQQFADFKKARHCRFCGGVSKEDVCGALECIAKVNEGCNKRLPCGHQCAGCRGDPVCPPCLHEGCDRPDAQVHGGDFCSICWVEELRAGPCVQLECGHMYHRACVVQKIQGKWPGLRITFGYLDCPLCKTRMRHGLLAAELAEHEALFVKVRNNAVNRLKVDGMLNDDRLVTPGSPYYQNPEMYALHSFAFYNCFKCKKAYFGGRRNCEQNQVENRDPSEMVCFDCGDVPKVDCKSPKEHAEFHEWKCRFCCKIAVWFCWGTTHFCEPCHQKAYEVKDLPADKLPKCGGKLTCPLKHDHPPGGTEFSLGCGICNNDAQLKKGGVTLDKMEKNKEEAAAAAAAAAPGPVAMVGNAVNALVKQVRRSSRSVVKKAK